MTEPTEPTYRTGIGTDIHPLVEGKKLMLGGVHIPFPAGLAGHSDGDALLHALIDALLGAAGLGDIGEFFPDTDPAYKNADSKALLLNIREKLQQNKWDIVNVDLIIHAEQPKLQPIKGQIKRCIADLLAIPFDAVNIKAKTNEGLGEIGRGEAIAATANVLLRKKYRRTL